MTGQSGLFDCELPSSLGGLFRPEQYGNSTLFGGVDTTQYLRTNTTFQTGEVADYGIGESNFNQHDGQSFPIPGVNEDSVESYLADTLSHEGYFGAGASYERADSVLNLHGDDATDEQPESDTDPETGAPKYDLRETARQKPAPTSWIDVDESGTYDPAAEFSKAHAPKRPASGVCVRDGTAPKRHVTYKSREFALSRGAQLPLTIGLKLFTDERLDRARSLIANIPDNWPEESYNHLDEEVFGKKDITGPRTDKSALPPVARWRSTQHGYDENGDYIYGQDPSGIEYNMLANQARRSCVPCRRSGLLCSLIEHRYSWPCDHCAQDGEDCQLIIPPPRKASCEACKRAKVKCSYRDQVIQPPKCNECASQLGIECIAGPAPGYNPISCRIGEQDHAPPPRRYASCCSCREQKIRCSLRKTDPPPCQSCTENDIPCIFEAVFKQGSKGKGKTASQANDKDDGIEMVDTTGDTDTEIDILEDLDPTPLALPDTDPSNMVPLKAPCQFDTTTHSKLPTFYIRTALCHPITFNCEISNTQFSDPFRDCSFCRDRTFELTGHYDFLTVKVQESNGGLCFDEKDKHGHYARNLPPTRVCCLHTMERHRIITCRHEDIHPIDSEVAAIIKRHFEDPDTTPRPDIMCSLCLGAMEFRCTVTRYTDECGCPLEGPAQGCGLQLCEYCFLNLSRFQGSVQGLVEDMQENYDRYVVTARADLELLDAKGLLPRNVEAELQQMMESES